MTKRPTGMWIRWSDGSMTYDAHAVRSKSDKFICRCVLPRILGRIDLTVRSYVRWCQIRMKALMTKGFDLSDDLPSLKRAGPLEGRPPSGAATKKLLKKEIDNGDANLGY